MPFSSKRGYNPFSHIPDVWACRTRFFLNSAGKGEIARKEQFLLFPQRFLPLWKKFPHFLSNLKLMSVNFITLEESRICRLVMGLCTSVMHYMQDYGSIKVVIRLWIHKKNQLSDWIMIWFKLISCFPVGYREISVKIFFDLTLVAPVKIPIFMFLLPRLIARASQPPGNMASFTLHFSRLT